MRSFGLAAGLFLACAIFNSSYAYTFFTDNGLFTAASPGGLTSEDFSGIVDVGFDGFENVCDPLSSGCDTVAAGATYSSGGSGLTWAAFNAVDFLNASLGATTLNDSLTIALTGAGTALSFTIYNEDLDFFFDDLDLTISIFDDGGGLLGTELVSVFALTSQFVGFVAGAGEFIGSVSIETNDPFIENGTIGLLSYNFNQAPVAAVPEPGTFALISGALGLLAWRRRRRSV